MSLVRLLSAGKSLVGAQDLEGKYRLPPNRPSREFGSSKNPFLTSPPAEGVRTTGNPQPTSSANEAQSSSSESSKIPAPSETSHSPDESPSTAHAGKQVEKPINRTGFWTRFKAPFSRIPKLLKRERKSAIPAFPKVPIQGELSLDRVKVLRNDLSETDLEVVPVKAAGKSCKAAGAIGTEKITKSEVAETNV